MMPMGDHFDEQHAWPSFDDEAVNALLAGEQVAAELAPVAAVVGALKDAATRPTPPRPDLAARMATGDFRRVGAPTALAAPDDPRALRMRLSTVFTGGRPEEWEAPTRLAAKAASVGFAVVLIVVSTAGFAGALPESAQDRFESVVEAVTPYEFPKTTVRGCGLARDPDGDPEQPGDTGHHRHARAGAGAHDHAAATGPAAPGRDRRGSGTQWDQHPGGGLRTGVPGHAAGEPPGHATPVPAGVVDSPHGGRPTGDTAPSSGVPAGAAPAASPPRREDPPGSVAPPQEDPPEWQEPPDGEEERADDDDQPERTADSDER
jgi:hypothetical protein